MENFSKESIDITKNISMDEKKKYGIFFTPKPIIEKTLSLLNPYLSNIKSILEPSCGSCEFINALDKLNYNYKIYGIELNSNIYNKIKLFAFNHKVKIKNKDFLLYEKNKKYDLILGNPPYFVMKKSVVEKKYDNIYDGRPNIYIFFIKKSLDLLKENGILSFIIPKNFLNCLYYNKLRQLINDKYKILNIQLFEEKEFLETGQDTILLMVQNIKGDNTSFSMKIHDYTIFNTPDNINQLKKYYENSTNLNEMGFNVSIGNVVWNQCKTILTDDNTKTRLIYSSDIKNNKLTLTCYKSLHKKNYIDKKGSKDIILVLNRGYGTGKYNLNFCLIDVDYEYLIENHLICIKPNDKNIKTDELRNKYKKIIKSLSNEKTNDFISIYFANNAINIKELLYILPIFI